MISRLSICYVPVVPLYITFVFIFRSFEQNPAERVSLHSTTSEVTDSSSPRTVWTATLVPTLQGRDIKVLK